MNAPFFKYGMFGDEMSLVVAFAIGIGFGFFLERAGFGKARLLAAQFYFRDLRVLKVMFTAIVTAMVGSFLLGRLGILDLSLVYLTPTFVVPQIVVGLILGVGFIVGGYCPGTSCVSAATGRIDGMVYLAGMVGGLLGFAEVYPYIAKFTKITALGQVTLSQQFGISYGLLVFAVVLMALGAFIAAEWAEKVIGGNKPGVGALLEPLWKLTPVRGFAVVLIGLGTFALFAGSPYRSAFASVDTRQLALDAADPVSYVTASDLADWIIKDRNDYLLIDVRSAAEFNSYHIPGATSIPLSQLNHDMAHRNERVLLVDDGGIQGAQAWLLLRALGFSSVHLLQGGIKAWKSEVLYPVAPPASASVSEQIEFAKTSVVAKHFGGAPQGAGSAGPVNAPQLPKLAAPLPTKDTSPSAEPPKKKKKEGC